MTKGNDYILRTLRYFGSIGPTSPILDFGCGTDAAVLTLHQLGFGNAQGYDIAPERIQQAQAAARRAGLHAQVFFSQADRLPDRHYVACFSNVVFEHVVDLEEAAQLIACKLRPDGFLIAWFPARFGVIEEHTFVPFAHWLPAGAFRRLYCEGFYKLGIASSPGAQCDRYLRDKTCYRSAGQIQRVFSNYFEEVRFVGLDVVVNHSRTVSRPIRSVASWALRLKELVDVETVFANIVTARLLCRRPIER